MKIKLLIEKEFEAKTLHIKAGVRYWEDATVNGKEDNEGEFIPFRNGDYWELKIDIDSGKVIDWPHGVNAEIHYKVCDDGTYWLTDTDNIEIVRLSDSYVPGLLQVDDNGYSDYIIMSIDVDGNIKNWVPDLSDFIATND